jgi:hypothetical protein
MATNDPAEVREFAKCYLSSLLQDKNSPPENITMVDKVSRRVA